MHSDLTCIIPDDGLGIKAETLDLDELIYFSIVDKSITGWDDE